MTLAGETLGYISLDQARILAMRTAREAPGDYGRRFRNVPMAFELVEANETEDYYEVTLSLRPQGTFAGTQGQEQFFIEKEGDVAVRQVLSLPTAAGGRRFPVIPAAIGLVVVVIVAVAGVVFATAGGGGDGEPTAPVTPDPATSTPLASFAQTAEPNPQPTDIPVSDAGALPTMTPMSTLVPTAAPKPEPSPVSSNGSPPSIPVPALKEGTQVFKEDFERGVAGGIQLGQGADVDCVAGNCFLRQVASGDAGGVTSWLGETFWQDYVLSVKFNIRDAGGGAAIIWRQSDAGFYNMDAIPGGGFHAISVAEPKFEKITVFQMDSPFSPGEWHTLTVQAEGGQTSFYMDGVALGATEVLDARAPRAGRVGLRTFSAPGVDGGDVWFDDVEVQLLSQLQIPTTPTPTPAPTPTNRPTPTPTPTPFPTPTPRPFSDSASQPGLPTGSLVEVSYRHQLFAVPNESYQRWEPGEAMYASRWNLRSTEPVSFTATFQAPPEIVFPDPLSVSATAEGKLSYQLSPDTDFMLILQTQLAVDNGLRLSRTMTPSTLSPGANQVVIDVTVEIVRLPEINGVTVRPVGGQIRLKVGETDLTLSTVGAESLPSKSGFIKPVRLTSVSGQTSMRLGPLVEPGQTYNLRVDAVFETPNEFPVSYVPTLDTYLDINATPFKVSLPNGIQTIAPGISFKAVGIIGEEVAFTFSNPSNEEVFWAITHENLPQVHQHWREQLQVAR